jgi:hypothetical protein
VEIIEKQYFEQKDYPAGYGRIRVETEQQIWDIIMGIMNENPTKKYLKHFTRQEWKPDGGTYHFDGSGVYPYNTEDADIPTGTYKEFLQVYVEDK